MPWISLILSNQKIKCECLKRHSQGAPNSTISSVNWLLLVHRWPFVSCHMTLSKSRWPLFPGRLNLCHCGQARGRQLDSPNTSLVGNGGKYETLCWHVSDFDITVEDSSFFTHCSTDCVELVSKIAIWASHILHVTGSNSLCIACHITMLKTKKVYLNVSVCKAENKC